MVFQWVDKLSNIQIRVNIYPLKFNLDLKFVVGLLRLNLGPLFCIFFPLKPDIPFGKEFRKTNLQGPRNLESCKIYKAPSQGCTINKHLLGGDFGGASCKMGKEL